MEVEAWMAVQPGLHLRMFVCAVIIQDEFEIEPRRGLPIEGFQKANEFLMTVMWHTVADHFAVQNVQRGEQSSGAVAFIVVGEGSAPARLHRQAPLGASQPPQLALSFPPPPPPPPPPLPPTSPPP